MDRRIKKTKQLLKNTLVSLMESHSILKISVTMITKKADLSRGTFYFHYLDIFDMIDKIEDEIINDIKKIIEKYRLDLINNDYTKTLLEIAGYVKTNKNLFRAFFSDNGDIAFMTKLKNEMMKLNYYLEGQHKDKISDKSIQYEIGNFIIYGGIGLFKDWIYNDCSLDPEYVITEMFNFFTNIRI